MSNANEANSGVIQTVACYRCHALMRSGDEAMAVIWPAIVVNRKGAARPSHYVRYLCLKSACNLRQPQR